MPLLPLSRREREVLTWLRHGKSNWEISRILAISERTVKFHVASIMRKLNAVTRTQAVALAMELGIFEEPADPPSRGDQT
jgi:DNA-binding CsgD family transcriptional regulator